MRRVMRLTPRPQVVERLVGSPDAVLERHAPPLAHRLGRPDARARATRERVAPSASNRLQAVFLWPLGTSVATTGVASHNRPPLSPANKVASGTLA